MYIASLLSSLLLSSTIVGAASIPRTLDESKLVLFGEDGRTEIVNAAEFWAAYHLNHTETPSAQVANGTSLEVDASSSLSKRCKSATIIYQNADQSFLNWDVQMSSVVKAGTQSSTVAVTQGYSISNSLTVSASADFTLVSDFLSTSFGISSTESWTSTYTAQYTYTVPAGLYGVVVSNPWTLRKSGYVASGCVGDNSVQKVTYQSDSYTSKAYDGLSWVTGTISLCTSKTYPVKNCVGTNYMH